MADTLTLSRIKPILRIMAPESIPECGRLLPDTYRAFVEVLCNGDSPIRYAPDFA
jgi:hypothetical protein